MCCLNICSFISRRCHNKIIWSIPAGELQEWRNPLVSEACPAWKWLRAQVSSPGEGGCEWEGCPSPVCVPQGKAPIPQRWSTRPDQRPQAYHLEPSLQERRGLELREVSRRSRRSPLQALQQEVPHQRYRGRHQEAPQPGKLMSRRPGMSHPAASTFTGIVWPSGHLAHPFFFFFVNFTFCQRCLTLPRPSVLTCSWSAVFCSFTIWRHPPKPS